MLDEDFHIEMSEFRITDGLHLFHYDLLDNMSDYAMIVVLQLKAR